MLKWNHQLWMTQYLDNIKSLNGVQALGDIEYVSTEEFYQYMPGVRETSAGWRETGHYVRRNILLIY